MDFLKVFCLAIVLLKLPSSHTQCLSLLTKAPDCIFFLNLTVLISTLYLARCNIQGSIICTNAYIKENASLKDCQVGDSHTIPEKG